MKKYQQEYNTPYQLKFPIEIEKIIETADPVYTFCEVIDHIDLNKYLTTVYIAPTATTARTICHTLPLTAHGHCPVKSEPA